MCTVFQVSDHLDRISDRDVVETHVKLIHSRKR